jgi:hypothetical protein
MHCELSEIMRDQVSTIYRAPDGNGPARVAILTFRTRRAVRGRHAFVRCSFCRSVHVPFSVHGQPGVDLDRGLRRTRLKSSFKKQQLEGTAHPASQE